MVSDAYDATENIQSCHIEDSASDDEAMCALLIFVYAFKFFLTP